MVVVFRTNVAKTPALEIGMGTPGVNGAFEYAAPRASALSWNTLVVLSWQSSAPARSVVKEAATR